MLLDNILFLIPKENNKLVCCITVNLNDKEIKYKLFDLPNNWFKKNK